MIDGTDTPFPGDAAFGLDADITRLAAGASVDLGAQADAAATGNGSLIAILKQVRAILTDIWDDAGNQIRTSASLTGVTAYTPYRNFMTTAAVISALVSSSARRLGYIHAFNVGAAPVFVRIYDKATAPATTDTPVWSGVLPGNTSGAGVALPIPDGLALALGLGVRVTAAIADNDATALVANEVMVSLGYRTS